LRNLLWLRLELFLHFAILHEHVKHRVLSVVDLAEAVNN
jgi:hypothetical protein